MMTDPKPTEAQIISIKLKGVSNYLLWAQAIKAFILSKDKATLLNDEPPICDVKDSESVKLYNTWLRDNS